MRWFKRVEGGLFGEGDWGICEKGWEWGRGGGCEVEGLGAATLHSACTTATPPIFFLISDTQLGLGWRKPRQ